MQTSVDKSDSICIISILSLSKNYEGIFEVQNVMNMSNISLICSNSIEDKPKLLFLIKYEIIGSGKCYLTLILTKTNCYILVQLEYIQRVN